jgi:hypothetical protein
LLVQDFPHLLVIASSFGEALREKPLLRPAFALNAAALPPIVYRPLDTLIFVARCRLVVANFRRRRWRRRSIANGHHERRMFVPNH